MGGDTLSFYAIYSGGCEAHEFIACWDGSFLESDPVQAPLNIVHIGNGDSCEALITEPISIDLTPLKEIYQSSYQTDSGTIILNFGDNATPNSITYFF